MFRPKIALYFKPSLLACAMSMALPALAQSAAPSVTLSEVVVSASADASAEGLTKSYAGGQVARGGRVGILGNQDMMDTPFSGTAYTSELIQNQQARSVADVLQNDPTVRLARGFGNFQELYMIRGFNVYSDDMAYNGLYGMLPRQYVAAELLERVEVFRGASAFLNGAAPGNSGIGGTVNVLPKRATNDPLTQVTLGIESGGQYLAAIDASRRFGEDKSSGLRINAVRRDGDTAIDSEKRELSVMALGWDWRSRDVRVSADLGYQNHKINQARPSVTPNGVIPHAPDSSKNFAQPWTYSNEKNTFGTVRAEVDLNDQVTAWFAAGMRKGEEKNVLANPTVNNRNGDTTFNRADNIRAETVTTAEAGIRGKLQTGSVGHAWVASVSTYSQKAKNAYSWSPMGALAGNLYSPINVPAPATGAAAGGFPVFAYFGGDMSDPAVTERTNLDSIALADTMSFINDRLLVTLGARQQTIWSRGYGYDGSPGEDYKKTKLTPMAGVIFKASKQVSVYANYSEALQKGETAPMTTGAPARPVTNGGSVTAPYVSEQKEIGIKYDGGKFGGGVSVFTVSKASGYVDATDTFVNSGEQRNRGIEFSAFGELQRGLRVLGGLTLLDAEMVKSGTSANNGKDAIGVPDTMANLGVEWDVPGVSGLSLNGRAVYTSSQFADGANTLELPSWTRFDLGARYLTTVGDKLVTWRARIDNVADKNYWASSGGYPGSNYLVLGAPRTFVLSASVEF